MMFSAKTRGKPMRNAVALFHVLSLTMKAMNAAKTRKPMRVYIPE